MANLLPRQLFLRVSALLPAISICLLVTVYFVEPSMETPQALAAPENQRLLEWLPSYWFFGLFHELNGSMRPELVPLARRAWIGFGVSFAGAGVALLLSYFRMLPKTVEQPDILSGGRGMRWSSRMGSSLRSAITLFSLRTLLRSRHHRMILSFYLGIGLAIIASYLKTPLGGQGFARASVGVPFLLASVLVMIFAILAMRVVAAIPISLGGNWIVRLTQVRPWRDYRRAVRFAWLVLVVAPMLVVVTGWLLTVYSWRPVVGHLVVLLLAGVILVELCLYTFQKIPFTCSYLPGKANIHFVFWATLLLFVRLLYEGAKFESRMLQRRSSCILMIVSLAIIAASMWWLNEVQTRSAEIVFEEEYAAEITGLKLN